MSKYLIIILVLSAILRIFGLNELPNGLSGDEVQQGYSAYSISKTGRDEWGDFLPINPRGFGDFKPPVYTYLAIPSVLAFGLNAAAVRLPAALVGILTLLVLYFLVKEMFSSEKAAVWSTFLMGISPWHIQLSRTAFEGGIGVLLFILGLLFFLKKNQGSKYHILSAVCLGLSLYSYHSFRLFTILFVIVLLIISKLKLTQKSNILFIFAFLIFLIPIFLNLKSAATRAIDVGIMNKETIASYFKDKGTTSLPPLVDKYFDNKFWFIGNKFLGNYLSYYSPTFFFTGLRSYGSYLNFPGYGLHYPLEIIFWLITIVILIKQGLTKQSKILSSWLVLAAVPAALADGIMAVNRAVTLLPLTFIISGLGITYLVDLLQKNYPRFKWLFAPFFVILLLGFMLSFLYFYVFKLPQNPPESLRYGYDQVFKKIWEVESDFDKIIISKELTEPQIFIGFYGQMDPTIFQQASQDWLRYESYDKIYVDQMESWNLGKFLFESIDWKNKDGRRNHALIVGKAKDFPDELSSIYDVKNPNGEIIFRLVPAVADEK